MKVQRTLCILLEMFLIILWHHNQHYSTFLPEMLTDVLTRQEFSWNLRGVHRVHNTTTGAYPALDECTPSLYVSTLS